MLIYSVILLYKCISRYVLLLCVLNTTLQQYARIGSRKSSSTNNVFQLLYYYNYYVIYFLPRKIFLTSYYLPKLEIKINFQCLLQVYSSAVFPCGEGKSKNSFSSIIYNMPYNHLCTCTPGYYSENVLNDIPKSIY